MFDAPVDSLLTRAKRVLKEKMGESTVGASKVQCKVLEETFAGKD